MHFLGFVLLSIVVYVIFLKIVVTIVAIPGIALGTGIAKLLQLSASPVARVALVPVGTLSYLWNFTLLVITWGFGMSSLAGEFIVGASYPMLYFICGALFAFGLMAP